jgi:hypothetical protein
VPPGPAPAAAAEPFWIIGDLHVHVSPPDADGHSRLTVASAIEKARNLGLDFIVLTPHDADRSFPRPQPAGDVAPETAQARADAGPVYGQELLALLADAALAAPGPDGQPQRPILVVHGWEYTRDVPGHLGASFFRMEDVAAVEGDRKTEQILANGGFVVVNHPFFRPVRAAPALERVLAASGTAWEGDWRWKPFFGLAKDADLWNGIEVWHDRSALVERLHAKTAAEFPDTQMVRAALRAWDDATKRRRARITAVGGSDCHGRLPYAVLPMKLVSVRIEDGTGEGLRKGLVGARVTFGPGGGVAARSFAATSDVPGERAGIGDSLRAEREVRLTWTGKATLIEDGVTVGEFDGGTTRPLPSPGAFRAWRIECPGDAFSNMIYANLP